LPPSSGSMNKPSKPQIRPHCLLFAFLLGLSFDLEDGDNAFLRNVNKLLQKYTELRHREPFFLVESLEFINLGEFCDELSDYQLLKTETLESVLKFRNQP
jgi:hypothetical protein